MTTYTMDLGESKTLAFDVQGVPDLTSFKVYIGSKSFDLVAKGGGIFWWQLTPNAAKHFGVHNKISARIESPIIGVQKIDALFYLDCTPSAMPVNSDATTDIVSVTTIITVAETAITVESIVYDYAKGTNGLTYVPTQAWASDAIGTDWSLTPTSLLKYSAWINWLSTNPNPPIASDFAGADWQKVVGDDGVNATGTGVPVGPIAEGSTGAAQSGAVWDSQWSIRDIISVAGYSTVKFQKNQPIIFHSSNTIYEIYFDHDLDGQNILIPSGCILKFIGGSLSNGIIKVTGVNDVIRVDNSLNCVGIFNNIEFQRTNADEFGNLNYSLCVGECFDWWFSGYATDDTKFDAMLSFDKIVISSDLSLSRDNTISTTYPNKHRELSKNVNITSVNNNTIKTNGAINILKFKAYSIPKNFQWSLINISIVDIVSSYALEDYAEDNKNQFISIVSDNFDYAFTLYLDFFNLKGVYRTLTINSYCDMCNVIISNSTFYCGMFACEFYNSQWVKYKIRCTNSDFISYKSYALSIVGVNEDAIFNNCKIDGMELYSSGNTLLSGCQISQQIVSTGNISVGQLKAVNCIFDNNKLGGAILFDLRQFESVYIQDSTFLVSDKKFAEINSAMSVIDVILFNFENIAKLLMFRCNITTRNKGLINTLVRLYDQMHVANCPNIQFIDSTIDQRNIESANPFPAVYLINTKINTPSSSNEICKFIFTDNDPNAVVNNGFISEDLISLPRVPVFTKTANSLNFEICFDFVINQALFLTGSNFMFSLIDSAGTVIKFESNWHNSLSRVAISYNGVRKDTMQTEYLLELSQNNNDNIFQIVVRDGNIYSYVNGIHGIVSAGNIVTTPDFIFDGGLRLVINAATSAGMGIKNLRVYKLD